MSKVSPKTPWFEVYDELSSALRHFFLLYEDQAGYKLYELLNSSIPFVKANSWLKNLVHISRPSIDPMHLFASFNRKGQSDIDRIKLINIISKLLSPPTTTWNEIDFEGCPILQNGRLQMMRPEIIQEKVWGIFEKLQEGGKNSLTILEWMEAETWSDIDIPFFTTFLFLIHHKQFLSLDKSTRRYLEAGGLLLINQDINFDIYKELLHNPTIKDYIRLSLEAMHFDVNPLMFQEKFRTGLLNLKDKSGDTAFRLIGIRVLERNQTVHKVLQPGYYPLDKVIMEATEISIDEEVEGDNQELKQELFEYRPTPVESVYHLQGLKVNITAIVGKNGSGKSTLLDLLLMGIYNLSIQQGYFVPEEDEPMPEPIHNLNIEIYWYSDTLYKMVFREKVEVFEFEKLEESGNKYMYRQKTTPISLIYLNHIFFYSVLVNYSHYALNSLDYKIDWITALSHKNDGYVAPIVINPQRKEGIIDINREKKLLNMRLLHNLLELHDPDIPLQSFRRIDEGKSIQSFCVRFDNAKYTEKKSEVESKTLGMNKVADLLIDVIRDVFQVTEIQIGNLRYIDALESYLVAKLLSIVERYPSYNRDHKAGLYGMLELYGVSHSDVITDDDLEMAIRKKFLSIVQDIKDDPSHVGLKFKQAVYYIKFPSLLVLLDKSIQVGEKIMLDDFDNAIIGILNSPQGNGLKRVDLLPPAIFQLEFYLDDFDQSSYSQASSGEYQLVSVLSSMLYHLRNIDSVKDSGRYRYVTLLLDEIELYFHPDLQRQFIKKLIDALSKIKTELYGVHVLFSTHSPFILSDIQQPKICKLEKGEIRQNDNIYNSFAANLHDLLADEFFLHEGFMGAFAQKKIEIAINQLHLAKTIIDLREPQAENVSAKEYDYTRSKLDNEKNMYIEKLGQLGYWNGQRNMENFDINHEQPYLIALIEAIGEPLIQDNLRTMYRAVFNRENNHLLERSNAMQEILRLMRDNNINPSEL